MLTKKQVQHVAKLARLGITKKEEEKFAKELSAILDYFKELKKIDTFRVEPCFYPLSLETVLRCDEVKEKPLELVNKLLESAPERKQRYIKVKAVF